MPFTCQVCLTEYPDEAQSEEPGLCNTCFYEILEEMEAAEAEAYLYAEQEEQEQLEREGKKHE